MVENDPSVMDLLQGRVIDFLGILKEKRTEGDIERADLIEIRNFVNDELRRDATDKQHGKNVSPGNIARITDALIDELRLACGEYINAGLSYADANKLVVLAVLGEFPPEDTCAAMKQYLQIQKKHRDANKNEVC